MPPLPEDPLPKDPLRTIIEELQASAGRGADLLQLIPDDAANQRIAAEIATRHRTGGLHFHDGEHATSPTLMNHYGASILKKLEEKGLTWKDSPLLRQLAELDGAKDANGQPTLSVQEIGAGLMGMDAFPNVNKDGAHLTMGMEFHIRPHEFDFAADPANRQAYLATVGQFLQDNFGVKLNPELGLPEDDKAYQALIKPQIARLQDDLGKKAGAAAAQRRK